jgi:hypothetical protein
MRASVGPRQEPGDSKKLTSAAFCSAVDLAYAAKGATTRKPLLFVFLSARRA